MFKKTPIASAIASVTAAMIAAASAVPAQAAEDQQLREETLIVTGSRIARRDFNSASPIVTVSKDLFEQTGSSTVETVLNTLPQFVPSVTNTSNNPSNGGQANVELRGLSTTRTLVLLDGRRVTPANDTGVVDLNLIPGSLIQNVEIITGGASAAYGSDAVAGVVNIKTRRIDGVAVDVDWGRTSEEDGFERSVTLSGGTTFADDRGHMQLSYTEAKRNGVTQGQRPFSAVALGYTGTAFAPLGSPTIRQGRFDTSTSNLPSQAAMDAVFGVGTVGRGQNLSFNPDGTIFSISPVVNFTGNRAEANQPVNDASYTYNFSPPNYLQLPLERESAFLDGSFAINDQAELYVRGIFASYDVDQALAATPATGLSIPVTNPFVPAQLASILASRPNPAANFTFRKRMIENGARISDNHYRINQYTAGVRGDITDTWSYDVYYQFGDLSILEKQLGNVSRARFQAALVDPTVCGSFNPFGLGSITPACAQYLGIVTRNTTDIEKELFEASASGPLFTLPAGEVEAAVGYFYTKDKYDYKPDAALFTGDVIGFNAQDPVSGDLDSSEFYGELRVPILGDLPGVHKLEAAGGYRYADYSSSGGVNAYKGELIWGVTDFFTLRGSYQRAVRAPNISELFRPQQQNFPSITGIGDPCSNTNIRRAGADLMLGTADDPSSRAQVEALCVAQGIPANALNAYNYSASQVEGLSGGNPNLFEETADTYSAGFVVRPNFGGIFENLSLSMDWYQIEIEDAIGAVAAGTAVDRCFSAAFNPTFTNSNPFCQFFRRDTTTSAIVDALEADQNLSAINTKGVDAQLDWAFEAGPGQLRLNWVVSYTDSYEQQELPGDAFEEFAGTAGDVIAAAFPEYKWNASVGYNVMGFDAVLRWRYVDEMVDQNFRDFKLDSVDYLDATVSYTLEDGPAKGLTVRAGVTNMTDEDPIVYPSYVQSNTDPSQYDVLGRRYFFNVSYDFSFN